MRKLISAVLLMTLFGTAGPAMAASDPIVIGDGLSFRPIIDGRLRYEHVGHPVADADAVTLRFRAGGELRSGGLSFLAESEATLGIHKHYNAFPFAGTSHQRRPQYGTVPDPENIELNRLQLQYKNDDITLTLGRQRINLDDQRFVGSVVWRQNEQTFDAIRGEAKAGPLNLDVTYAKSQRTLFGIDAGPRQAYDGKFWFLGAEVQAGPVNLKGFSYLLDYDPAFFATNSSKTFGVRGTTSLPLASNAKLNLAGSYARQSDHGSNPIPYAADYYAAEANLAVQGFTLTGGFEQLGSDKNAANGAGHAIQTPMATVHKFNGWADVFGTTPNRGLRDFYVGAAYRFEGVQALPGLNAAVIWHRFDSTTHKIDYGREWDASLGFRLGQVAILAKYANYKARNLGADTRKFWLQAEYSY